MAREWAHWASHLGACSSEQHVCAFIFLQRVLAWVFKRRARCVKRRVAQRLLGLSLLWQASLAWPANFVLADDPLLRQVFPQADEVTQFSGEPPLAHVRKGGVLLAYALLTDQVVTISGYSGRPIRTLVLFDEQGLIRGVRVVHHEEPILAAGIRAHQLQDFVGQYGGLSVADKLKFGGAPHDGAVTLDGISGATITAMVLHTSIVRSVREALATPRAVLPALDERAALDAVGVSPWSAHWHERRLQVAGLLLGLLLLIALLLLQDRVVRRPSYLRWLRGAFLLYTVFYLGFYAMAQLSVVQVLRFLQALRHSFHWDVFLNDPVIFLLWGFVAVSVLLWGRAVYCGWLCPFGALQAMLYWLARRMRLPKIRFPSVVHERLSALKYVIFILLFGVSLQSVDAALRYAEVEPFKSVFTQHLQRDWPFVAYVATLLFIALFNKKFFCKYLCPLGAALAIPSGFMLFNWLRRRRECGRPCQVCHEVCQMQAIYDSGKINARECHYCLDCQRVYYDVQACPPLSETQD